MVDLKCFECSNQFNKNNFRLSVARKLTDKFRIRLGADYYRSDRNTVGTHGSQVRPLYWYILNTPTNVDLTSYRDWKNDLYSTPDNYYNELRHTLERRHTQKKIL